VVIGGGFAVVNVVVVGQILAAVSGYTMTIAVGCILIAVISYVVSVFGFSLIHTYEKYSWIASVILLLILIGEVGGKVDASIPSLDTGLGLSGSFLCFWMVLDRLGLLLQLSSQHQVVENIFSNPLRHFDPNNLRHSHWCLPGQCRNFLYSQPHIE